MNKITKAPESVTHEHRREITRRKREAQKDDLEPGQKTEYPEAGCQKHARRTDAGQLATQIVHVHTGAPP